MKSSFAFVLLASIGGAAFAQAPPASAAEAAQPVTIDNFIRAESDVYMGNSAKEGGFGKLVHRREPASIDNQIVIRLNRDTLYSSGVFDLDAGPVTITLPDAGSRFMSVQVISEDHYTWTEYGAGPHAFDKAKVGARYAMVGIRTLVDPKNPNDLAAVHKLQDAIKVSQPGGPGTFDVPSWDTASQKKVRDALLVLASTRPSFDGAFGKKGDVDPVSHLLGTAAGWGGNPDRDARYINVTPAKNDGRTMYRVTVKDVPVDAFWSISVYNAQGYYEKNAYNAYSVNSVTGKKDKDGAVTIQFGGCDGKIANCIPITNGWNCTVRLYRPRAEILDGSWKFPEPQPVN